MKLYMTRHGTALPPDINIACPLSEAGEKEIEKLADFLKKKNILVQTVYHSSKKRAKQTAIILKNSVCPSGDIRLHTHIEPDSEVEFFLEEINHFENDTLIVSHLPFIEKCMTALITQADIRLSPGTLICLERIEKNRWVLSWIISPELISF